MRAIVELVRSQPVAFGVAVRMTILAATAFGLSWTPAQIVALMAAIEAWLGFLTWRNSTSTAAPVLAPDTVVKVAGTSDSVVIAPTPPGPIGISDGVTAAGSPTRNADGAP